MSISPIRQNPSTLFTAGTIISLQAPLVSDCRLIDSEDPTENRRVVAFIIVQEIRNPRQYVSYNDSLLEIIISQEVLLTLKDQGQSSLYCLKQRLLRIFLFI